MTWKQFISLKHFKELKALFILEFIIIGLLILLCQTPTYQEFITLNQLAIFNPFALLATIFAYSLSTCIDPEKYFNLATLISVGGFTYAPPLVDVFGLCLN